jgi:hypothetical protein
MPFIRVGRTRRLEAEVARLATAVERLTDDRPIVVRVDGKPFARLVQTEAARAARR